MTPCESSFSIDLSSRIFTSVCVCVRCHIPERTAIYNDWGRVLKTGGMFMFTDAMVVSGLVSSDEFATRSIIGKYYYPPVGENEVVA